jgi:hypothetical protein
MSTSQLRIDISCSRIDMEIKDVREFEKVQHQETNEKVVGAGPQDSSESTPSPATRQHSSPN